MPVFNSQESKIKMTILTKGNNENRVWYSPIKDNKKTSERIIKSMLRRFEKNKLMLITNVVQFYENDTLVYQQNVNSKQD